MTGGYPPYWTSDDPADREKAGRICRACAARIGCAEWSLAVPVRDNAIYAAQGAQDRIRARRQPSTGQ